MKVEKYIYEGFGFPVLLNNIEVQEAYGKTIPIINTNKLSVDVARALILSRLPYNGFHLKFLRTFLGMSVSDFSKEIDKSRTTISNWEALGSEIISNKDSAVFDNIHILVSGHIMALENKNFQKAQMRPIGFDEEPIQEIEIGDGLNIKCG